MTSSKIYKTADGKEFTDANEAFQHEKSLKVRGTLEGIGLDEMAINTILANPDAVSEALDTLNAKRRGRKAGVPNKDKAAA